jgi:hypothetical protein
MMRNCFVGFFLLLFVLNSCQTTNSSSLFSKRIKTVRVGDFKNEQVVSKQNKVIPVNSQEIFSASSDEVESVNANLVKTTLSTEKSEQAIYTETFSQTTPNQDDSSDFEDREIKALAYEAEFNGKRSRDLSITGLLLSFIPFVGLAGLILSIIALAKGIKALNARYITEDGLRWAKTGVIISGISIGLRLLAIFLLILLLVIIF